MKKVKIEELKEIREVTEAEMEQVAAGWGFGACIGLGIACTSSDAKGLGVKVALCWTIGFAD